MREPILRGPILREPISRETLFCAGFCADDKKKSIRRDDSWGGGIFLRADPFALFNGINLIHGEIAEMLYEPARPCYFDAVNLRFGTEAEVQPKIVLRKVAAAAANLIKLHELSGMNCKARANGRAIAFRALQVECNPVISVGQMIAQKSWRFADVQNQRIDCPIIPNVAERYSTA